MRNLEIGRDHGILVALASLWQVPGEKSTWRGVFHDRNFDNYTVDLSLEAAADGGPPLPMAGHRIAVLAIYAVSITRPKQLGKMPAALVCLRKNYGNSTNQNMGDCGYTGVETLPDGRVLAMPYGHWDVVPGSKHPNHPGGRGEAPYIKQFKLSIEQTDKWVKDFEDLVEMPRP